MNYRQWKKQVYKKRKKHGYWKSYKKVEREFWNNVRLHKEFPNRKRVRLISKLSNQYDRQKVKAFGE